MRQAALILAAALAACAGPGERAAAPTVETSAEAASAAEAAPGARTVAMQIEAVEKAWVDALLRKDKAELERLMAPDFTLVGHGDGAMTTRADWLANLERMTIQAMRVRVTDVAVAGDTAVAKVEGDWTVAMGGPARRDSFALVDTWVRQGGAWRVTKRVRTGSGASIC